MTNFLNAQIISAAVVFCFTEFSSDPFPPLQADDPKEAAKDILARAAARGIITGVPTKNDKKKKKGTKKKDKAKKEKKDGPPKDAKAKKGKVSSAPAIFWPRTNHQQSMRVMSHTQSMPNANLSQPASEISPVRSQTICMQLFSPLGDGSSRRPSPRHLSSSSVPSVTFSKQYVAVPEHRRVVQHPNPFR